MPRQRLHAVDPRQSAGRRAPITLPATDQVALHLGAGKAAHAAVTRERAASGAAGYHQPAARKGSRKGRKTAAIRDSLTG